jgi:nucleoside 2-deoxyribosyltransferase
MKVYLAAAWSRRAEIEEVAVRLRKLGVEVTSNWLTEEKAQQTGAMEKFLRDRAYLDLNDVACADAIVRFTDPEFIAKAAYVATSLASGARHFEMGYAKALGKTMYVVGGKQNVFDRLDGVVHLKDVDELCQVLSQEG